MNRLTIIFITFIIGLNYIFGGTLLLDGVYQGENLYVKNPYKSSGVGFCAYEVRVNGDLVTDEVNQSAFEINLRKFDLVLGTALKVEIFYEDDCEPKVINPEVLRPKSTYVVVNMELKDSVLNWTTKDEMGALMFDVEMYWCNKWVKVGEVMGKGTQGSHSYAFKVDLHSGENKFRVKQHDSRNKNRVSKPLTVNSEVPAVEFSPKKVNDNITFTGNTRYEIFDAYGDLVVKGYGTEIDCQKLKKGVYYILYDNKNAEFLKK